MALAMDRCGTQRAARAAQPAHLHSGAPQRSVANAAQGRRLSNKKLRALLRHSAPTAAAALAQAPSRGTAVRTFAVAAAEVKTQVRGGWAPGRSARVALVMAGAAVRGLAAALGQCSRRRTRQLEERLEPARHASPLPQRVYLFGKSASQGDASMKNLVRSAREAVPHARPAIHCAALPG
jgi:hypothetical protein